jgi:putative ABC transport system ATP-binding protein
MIKIKNLNKIYDNFQALKDINLHIKKGEIVVLKGVSGSGKSTLLSLIASMSKPSSGSVEVNNILVSKLPDVHSCKYRNENIGYIFQSFNLLEQLSVADNIFAPLVISEAKNKQELLEIAMKKANIYHKKDEIVSNLSGGEKQRCAIARAIVLNPNIIIADEPTASLDKQNSLKFIDVLKEFKKEKRTVIISTHDSIFDNLDLVSRYINIQDGQIVD